MQQFSVIPGLKEYNTHSLVSTHPYTHTYTDTHTLTQKEKHVPVGYSNSFHPYANFILKEDCSLSYLEYVGLEPAGFQGHL